MAIDRNGAVDFAKKFWNRVADDDKFWTSNEPIITANKRKKMNAPKADGWEVFFVPDGHGEEDAVFCRFANGKIVERKADPVAGWDLLDDCTHYVCRCLMEEGISLKETPRANELTEAMISHQKTKTLAVRTNQAEGQKVVDSGIFKPGDMVGYYTRARNRYTHTAMFVGFQLGTSNDPGGITCHTLCRFQGLTKDWNGATDDNWFLHEGLDYTLIHFSEDDPVISQATLGWLPGWWSIGKEFYFVSENGRAFATHAKPSQASFRIAAGTSQGYYFDLGNEILFIWRRPGAKAQVERWSRAADTGNIDVKIDGTAASVSRVF